MIRIRQEKKGDNRGREGRIQAKCTSNHRQCERKGDF